MRTGVQYPAAPPKGTQSDKLGSFLLRRYSRVYACDSRTVRAFVRQSWRARQDFCERAALNPNIEFALVETDAGHDTAIIEKNPHSRITCCVGRAILKLKTGAKRAGWGLGRYSRWQKIYLRRQNDTAAHCESAMAGRAGSDTLRLKIAAKKDPRRVVRVFFHKLFDLSAIKNNGLREAVVRIFVFCF